MAKRELIDRIHLLAEIKKLQKSPWYNHGKNGMVIIRALYNERKEAVEVVRDLCVNDESAITEQEIVKPYLDKIRAEIEEQVLESLSDGGDDWFTAEKVNECLDIIDKYKAESEVSE